MPSARGERRVVFSDRLRRLFIVQISFFHDPGQPGARMLTYGETSYHCGEIGRFFPGFVALVLGPKTCAAFLA